MIEPHVPDDVEKAATLKVDDEHLRFRRADGSRPAMYLIPPIATITLDTTGYQLRPPAQIAGKAVNCIQFMVESEQYSAVWHSGRDKHVLSAETLRPIAGSVPFAGLQDGNRGAVAIGYLDADNFYVYWAGMFQVQTGAPA